MEHNSTETGTPDASVVRADKKSRARSLFNSCKVQLSQYVEQHPQAKNTKLFSFLALLNAYVPDSYIMMDECQRILGPPDPIHGGPPFEERMEPFTVLINTSGPVPGRVCMIHPEIAKSSVAELKISRGDTMYQFLCSLCEHEVQPYMVQFIKDLLTRREMGKYGKYKFSRLIYEIHTKQGFHQALSVLDKASDIFRQNPNFPQTIARLCYLKRHDYKQAVKWAHKAITRAPGNSYMADTLGQIHKNKLLRTAKHQRYFVEITKKAYKAFKHVERKAKKEEGQEMKDTAGVVSTSDSFNNRGLFGFIQVAKIVFDKLGETHAAASYPHLQKEVEDKFDFFEWYLTYSEPDMKTLEPDFFWKVVALCYEYYTHQTAAESTSFPGLLNCLDHGLFSSKGSRAGFEEAEKTEDDLERIRDDLRTLHETNVDDVQVAERYILSNIVLSNKMLNSAPLSLVKKLQRVIHRFSGTEVTHSPEFYLLVLMLFWPEEHLEVTQEEDAEKVELEAAEEDGSQDKSWEDVNTDEDQDTGGEPAQLSPDLMSDRDVQDIITDMEEAYKRGKYAKYLRGRYLLPLFFLGKGSGLSRWIHKSRLDVVVERMVEEEERGKLKKLDAKTKEEMVQRKKKIRLFNDMWIKGKVWPQIKDMLLPVQVEPCTSSMAPQQNEKVFVYAGGKKIKARVEVTANGPSLSNMVYYLGFTIQGPVVFRVGAPHSEQ